MDYRRWFDDSGMLYAYDLEDHQGRDAVFQIEKAWGGEVTGEKGRKSKKPIIKFVGLDKTLALNKTNGKSIAKMYGKDGSKWAGCWVTLYVTTVDYDGETRDCIRIRPNRPEVQRPAQNGHSGRGATSKQLADDLVMQFDGCDDRDVFDAIEKLRGEVWGRLSKDDKLTVKAAASKSHARILEAQSDAATKQHEPSASEQAEIAAQEAQQS